MNLLYSLPFWPYLYTPWLFREIAWMKARGHHLAIVSLGDPPGPAADLTAFGLQDIPVLQVRSHNQSDRQLLVQLLGLGTGVWRSKTRSTLKSLRQTRGLRQGLHEWITTKRVLRFVKEHRIDVIEAHWAAHSAMLAREITLTTGIPYAVRMHGGDLHSNPSPNLQQIVESAAAVCPVSQFLADLLLGKRPVASLPQVPPVHFDQGKLHICHNGIPASIVADQAASQSTDEVVVGMIGRLDPPKRHRDLLSGVARLAPRHPKLRIRLVGGGVLEPDLREQAQKLGIAERLEITGSLPWDEVIQAVRTLSIYAHTSELEGCSLAILEAQAQGLPMLLSHTGAATQCVTENINGHLFQAGDVDAMTAALENLISIGPQARQAMGQASIDQVKKHFVFDTVMMQVEEILGSLIQPASVPTSTLRY